MDKAKLSEYIGVLEESVRRFDRAETRQNYLPKKNDREAEQKIKDNEIQVMENYFLSNPELNAIFSEGKSHFEYEEAFTNRYFSRDFHRFISELREMQGNLLD